MTESRFILGRVKSKVAIEKPDVNIDEELERFVAQIEENTFTILSTKQKFSLMLLLFRPVLRPMMLTLTFMFRKKCQKVRILVFMTDITFIN
jgi:hypothetical protein